MIGKKGALLLLTMASLLLVAVYVVGWSSAAKTNPSRKTGPNAAKINALLAEMETVDLDSLPALPIEKFSLPESSVDVMRVRMEETYDIDGVGKDTVELRGWIAVRHDDPRAAVGETEVKWGTAVSNTEFV